jgi:putative membrane protein
VRAVHWFVTLPLTVAFVVFAISNRQAVEVTFWPLPIAIESRLFLVVLLAMFAGFLIGELVAWIGGRRWRREARDKARRIDSLERELAATQALLRSPAAGSTPAGTVLSKQS